MAAAGTGTLRCGSSATGLPLKPGLSSFATGLEQDLDGLPPGVAGVAAARWAAVVVEVLAVGQDGVAFSASPSGVP